MVNASINFVKIWFWRLFCSKKMLGTDFRPPFFFHIRNNKNSSCMDAILRQILATRCRVSRKGGKRIRTGLASSLVRIEFVDPSIARPTPSSRPPDTQTNNRLHNRVRPKLMAYRKFLDNWITQLEQATLSRRILQSSALPRPLSNRCSLSGGTVYW